MTEHPSSGNAPAQQQSAADVPDAALIERILDTQIRPLLHIHGGDIRLVSLSARGDLELEFDGARAGLVP